MNVSTDQLLIIIGRQTVEKELLVRTNEELARRLAALEQAQAESAEQEEN